MQEYDELQKELKIEKNKINFLMIYVDEFLIFY